MADEEGVDCPNYVDFRPNRRYLTESTFVRETFLSERLGEAIGMCMVADREQFSWVTPHHHGLVGWKHRLVENRRLGWHPSMSPVPITVEQKNAEAPKSFVFDLSHWSQQNYNSDLQWYQSQLVDEKGRMQRSWMRSYIKETRDVILHRTETSLCGKETSI